eukprot:1158801-Pelagomonas_calceolata.AAC.10
MGYGKGRIRVARKIGREYKEEEKRVAKERRVALQKAKTAKMETCSVATYGVATYEDLNV